MLGLVGLVTGTYGTRAPRRGNGRSPVSATCLAGALGMRSPRNGAVPPFDPSSREVAVGDEDGRVPVAEFVAGLRAELKEAQETRDPGLQFKVGPVQVEFTVVSGREGGPEEGPVLGDRGRRVGQVVEGPDAEGHADLDPGRRARR